MAEDTNPSYWAEYTNLQHVKHALIVAMPDWMEPFARTIDAAKKYVVSSTLDRVDWNAELVRGDLGKPFNSSSGSRVRDCSWEA